LSTTDDLTGFSEITESGVMPTYQAAGQVERPGSFAHCRSNRQGHPDRLRSAILVLPSLAAVPRTPACLLEAFGDDAGRLDRHAAGKVLADLLGMAHDEGFADLDSACLEYRRRIHPGSRNDDARRLPFADSTYP
jgi:hypothetical protein